MNDIHCSEGWRVFPHRNSKGAVKIHQMLDDVSLLQLPRLCIWTGSCASGRLLSGCGPFVEQYRASIAGEYQLAARVAVFSHCARPVTAIGKVSNADSFVITGSSLLCILKECDLERSLTLPSSRVHSFDDEIVTIGCAMQKDAHAEIGVVLRSGRMLLVHAALDATNRLRVDTVAEYDRAKCGLLMSALCMLPHSSSSPWQDLRTIAGSAMGEVQLWTTGDAASRGAKECGAIGFVIAMAEVERCEKNEQLTLVAITENRAISLWNVRYNDTDWLQLLQRRDAAHAVRPSAVSCCSRLGIAVSAAEDGELCVWNVRGANSLNLLRRFEYRVGAVRSLDIDFAGNIVLGSATGALLVHPLQSLTAAGDVRFMEGAERVAKSGGGRTPIRAFTAAGSCLHCLGEDGSTFEMAGDAVKKVDAEGSFYHMNEWKGNGRTITVLHNDKQLRIAECGAKGGSPSDDTTLRAVMDRYSILTARATMSEGKSGRRQTYVLVQATSGGVLLIELRCRLRIWRYSMPPGAINASGRKHQSQLMIANTVAIDKSDAAQAYLICGTINGRILYAPIDRAEQIATRNAEDDSISLDDVLCPNREATELKLHLRAAEAGKTPITQLEYCESSGEGVALTKNGWLWRWSIEEGVLHVREEEISRESEVQWPIEIARRGEHEYVVGFNERSLVVVSRRSKRCLMSIDCGGGHRQAHVELGEDESGEVDKITVYYGKHQGIVRHVQRALTYGARELAWTPHRDKIVYFIRVGDANVLAGSIDGEIVLGVVHETGLTVLHRWYVPETTAACVVQRGGQDAYRAVIGGPKGSLHVVDWNREKLSTKPQLSVIETRSDTRIIDVAFASENYVVVAFSDAKIAVFDLATNEREQRIGCWEMPSTNRSSIAKIVARSLTQSLEELRIDAATTAGILIRLSFNTTSREFIPLADVVIDRSSLTVIRRDAASDTTIMGADSGTIFACRDTEDGLDVVHQWADAHCTQITDVALCRTVSGQLRIVSVGMDCAVTVLELDRKALSLIHRGVFAVNDPAAICLIGDSRAIVAGCGLQEISL